MAPARSIADSHDQVDEGLFKLLASPRRQLLLRSLVEHDGDAPLRELSRDIAAHETDSDPEAIESEEITRVYVSLYQTHVPVLQESDLVEYDDSESVVYLDDCPDEIAHLLENWDQRRRRWALYYLIVAVTLLGLAVAYVVGSIRLPETVLSAFTIVAATALLLLALAHYYGVWVLPLGDHPFDNLTPLDR